MAVLGGTHSPAHRAPTSALSASPAAPHGGPVVKAGHVGVRRGIREERQGMRAVGPGERERSTEQLTDRVCGVQGRRETQGQSIMGQVCAGG